MYLLLRHRLWWRMTEMAVLSEGTPNDVRGLELGHHLMGGWRGVIQVLLEERHRFSLVKCQAHTTDVCKSAYRVPPPGDRTWGRHLMLQVQGACPTGEKCQDTIREHSPQRRSWSIVPEAAEVIER